MCGTPELKKYAPGQDLAAEVDKAEDLKKQLADSKQDAQALAERAEKAEEALKRAEEALKKDSPRKQSCKPSSFLLKAARE